MLELVLAGLVLAGGVHAAVVAVVVLESLLALQNPQAGFPALLVTSSFLIEAAACRRR